MKIVDQSFVELNDNRLYQKVEICGRVCYKSEDKMTGTSGLNFVKKICVNNHGSVLEHFSVVLKISQKYYDLLKTQKLPYFELTNITYPIVSFNLRAFVREYNLENRNENLNPIFNYMSKNYPDLYEYCPVSEEECILVEDFSSLSVEERNVHQRITIKLVTDRGVSHELVRHRLASFSQESTRYCNYAKDKFQNEITVIKPINLNEESFRYWKQAMEECEKNYFKMLENKSTPQQARSVLPNSLKTEICITASLEEWKLIFELRCAVHAHPDCKLIMDKVKAYFIEKGYLD